MLTMSVSFPTHDVMHLRPDLMWSRAKAVSAVMRAGEKVLGCNTHDQ